MIVKMKKLILLLSDSAADVDTGLTALGQLGVMHVMPLRPASNESIDRVEARIKQLEKAISVLNQYDDDPLTEAITVDPTDYSQLDRGEIILMEKVLNAEYYRSNLEELKARQINALEWYDKWGHVSPTDLELIRKKGISLKLYLVDDRELKKIQDREDIHFLGKSGNINRVALITDDTHTKLDYQEVALPEMEADNSSDLLHKVNQQLEENKKLFIQFHTQKSVLLDALEERVRRMDVRKIQYGGIPIVDQVRCWKGFIPEDSVDEFVKMAEKNNWGYVLEEPAPEEIDEVPTLIRSSAWAERIRPVMNFMGLVPGYKELDVSKVFMLFFTFFTGILVGDAGYGVIFLLITLFVHGKKNFLKNTEFELMYTLSASVIFWGVLTGTYFGSETLAQIPFLSMLKINRISSFGGDIVFVQKFMFLIGAIHLTIGHLQTAWKYNNSVIAIAQLGWVAIIWGLYLIVNQMVLGILAPPIMIWLFIAGALLIAFFSNPGTSFIKGVVSSLGNLPLSIINGFSDIISYIRLYAVGLSTVLMATSFNQMALGHGLSTIASGIGAVIVLLLGHGLNMVLAAMAVLVHGVRLNMLEYAGHANVEFSGNEYIPFKLKNQKS